MQNAKSKMQKAKNCKFVNEQNAKCKKQNAKCKKPESILASNHFEARSQNRLLLRSQRATQPPKKWIREWRIDSDFKVIRSENFAKSKVIRSENQFWLRSDSKRESILHSRIHFGCYWSALWDRSKNRFWLQSDSKRESILHSRIHFWCWWSALWDRSRNRFLLRSDSKRESILASKWFEVRIDSTFANSFLMLLGGPVRPK